MRSYLFREETHYSIKDFSNTLGTTEEESKRLISILRTHGIIKPAFQESPDIDLFPDEEEIINTQMKSYGVFKFRFVGVLVVEDYVIFCYPKYVSDKKNAINELKRALNAIKKYNYKEKRFNFQADNFGNRVYNELAISLFLLSDYFDNGLYSNQISVYDINGLGEIDWQKSIDENTAILDNNIPYYFELYTFSSQINENDYFRMLHACILSKCSQFLSDIGILELFGMTPLCLANTDTRIFGSEDYIKYKLKNRINTEFITGKHIVLKTMLMYFEKSNSSITNEHLNFWGSFSFNLVWEAACKNVFVNKLSWNVSDCFPHDIVPEKNNNMKLIELIDKPEWYVIDSAVPKTTKETLRPDLITIHNSNNKIVFVICDAKYYNIVLSPDELLKGNPGVEDVTKQYLYQLAYKDILEEIGINKVQNCFIMPSDESIPRNLGYVSLSFLKNLGLADIQIIKYPAMDMLDRYIQNKEDSILSYLIAK